MNEVKYKPEFLEIVKDLATINSEILIEKNDNEVYILRQDVSGSLRYHLKAPKEFFDFETENMAFYNYAEFYKYFKFINEPKLFLEEPMIVITDNQATIEYQLTNSKALSKNGTCDPVNKFPEVDIQFTLSKQDLDTISKMCQSFAAKHIKLYGDGDEFFIKVIASDNSNSFIKSFEFENMSKFDEKFDFVIFAEVFKNIPQKRNYVVSVVNKNNRGFVRFHDASENNMTLDLYTTYVSGKR